MQALTTAPVHLAPLPTGGQPARARLSRGMQALTTAPSSRLSPQVGSLPELDSRAVKSSVKKDWRQWLGPYARVDDLMVNGRPAYR